MGRDPGSHNVSLGAIRPYILGESLFETKMHMATCRARPEPWTAIPAQW